MRWVFTLGLAALLASPGAAWAAPGQTPMVSVEAGSASSAPTNDVPLPRKSSLAAEAADQVGTAVSAGEQMHNVAGAVGEAKGLVDRSMAKTSTKFLNRAGTFVQGSQIGIEVADGNYGAALRKGAAMVIDRCVDVVIASGCAMVSVPTGGAVFPACEVAAQAVRFCGEIAAGKSLGEWAVEGVAAGYGGIKAFVTEKQRKHDVARADQQAQFTATQANNDQQAIANTARPQPASQSQTDDGSGALAAALMSGIFAASAPPTAPLAPSPAPVNDGSCHPGHNESAHPGGCHAAPLGNR